MASTKGRAVAKMYRYDLTRISVTHEALADWLLANPGKGQLKKAAVHFNYTESYVYTLVNTDSFQAMLKAKAGDCFEETVIPLRAKIMGTAQKGVDRMGEILDTTNDDRLARDITRDMLTATGLMGNTKTAAASADGLQINIQINQGALAQARERRSEYYRSVNEGRALPNPESGGPTTTEELQARTQLAMGEAREIRAESVNSSEKVHGEEGSGS